MFGDVTSIPIIPRENDSHLFIVYTEIRAVKSIPRQVASR